MEMMLLQGFRIERRQRRRSEDMGGEGVRRYTRTRHVVSYQTWDLILGLKRAVSIKPRDETGGVRSMTNLWT